MTNYGYVLNEVAKAAALCGRDPAAIKLVAVTKGHTWDEAAPIYAEGCRDFGESRQAEALDKQRQAPDDISWHFIGTLQRNKVRKVVGRFSLIHSVDTVELAEKISTVSAEVGCITPILLQVNSSGEPTKHGLSAELWHRSLETLLALPAITLQGVMAIAPFTEDFSRIRHCFSSARRLRDALAIQAADPALFTELSMGMSHDYRIAIAEGATLLRIGSALFS